MAWCLMAPSHYLSQYWSIITEIQWKSPEGNFTIYTSAINEMIEANFKITYLKFNSNFPGANELKPVYTVIISVRFPLALARFLFTEKGNKYLKICSFYSCYYFHNPSRDRTQFLFVCYNLIIPLINWSQMIHCCCYRQCYLFIIQNISHIIVFYCLCCDCFHRLYILNVPIVGHSEADTSGFVIYH